MNKLFSSMKYFSYGLQFTTMIVVPFLVCIFIGGYLQKKYGLGDWVIGVSVIFALVLMITDVFVFGRMILKKINEKSGREPIDKQGHKK